jgi:hypothetical protein
MENRQQGETEGYEQELQRKMKRDNASGRAMSLSKDPRRIVLCWRDY